jgi:hypothetical protein
MDQIKLTRKELYDLVWAEPLSRLAKRHKISDNGLRKICKRMNIPIPAMGHWQKIQYNKKVAIIKLPEKYDGKDEIILNEKGSDDAETDSPLAQQRRLVSLIESAKDIELQVPPRLSSRPDKLITSTDNYYEAYRKRHRGNYPSYPERINVLDIEVSEENIPRALRLLDTIIKALRLRKHDVAAERFSTYAIIGDEKVKFRLREKKRMSEATDQFGFHQYELTGEFVFVIDIGPYRRKEVKDSHEPVEKKVSTIIAMLELEGKRMKEERIASEIRRKQWEEQEKIERELRERQEKEAKAFKKLFLKAVRLHQADIIRNYIQTVEANAIRNGNTTEEFTQWLAWAEQKVSWYDPLANGPDPLLNDHHKTHLFKEFLKEWQ